MPFVEKVKPAEVYYDFKPCCDKMRVYKGFFSINDRSVAIYNPVRPTGADWRKLSYSVDIEYCPFCGKPINGE